MTVSELDIEEVVRAVWDALFDLPLSTDRAARLGIESMVTGCIQINGAWQGAVLIQCPLELASTLTAAMFGAAGPPPMEDVRDAIGELANIVAGNIKSLLPEPSHISLPAVALGPDQHFGVVGTRAVTSVSFACQGYPLLVTLLATTHPGHPAPAAEDRT